MEVPGPGDELEPQLLAYSTATATLDLSHIGNLVCAACDLCQILNPLSEARNRTHILIDTSRVLNLLSHNGIS